MRFKKAEILTGNLIFIILNLLFFSILFVFIISKAGDSSSLEEAYAKKIALLIDSSKPGTKISIDMASAIDKKDKDYSGKVVFISGNVVTVQLREKGGYSYSFFNDVEIDPLYSLPSEKEYSFVILDKQKEES